MLATAMIRRSWAVQARRVAFTVALTTAAMLMAAARAQSAGNQTRTDSEWLQAIQNAAQRSNYSGTIYYQQGGEVRSSRIVHQFDGTVAYQRVQMLDGERREYVRKGDAVQCLLPDAKRVIIEKRPIGGNFPALSTSAPEDILRFYSLRRGPIDRVADLECRVIELEPKDADRYGYRLWVERATGLLLRAQMLKAREEVIEQVAFTEVRIGEPFDASRLKASWPTDGWRVDKVETKPVELGWAFEVPPGFRQQSAVVRRFSRGGAHDTLQAVYSDGLATFSVFIEPDQGSDSGASSGRGRSRGPVSAYVHRLGDTMITVVGEVPPETVRNVALSVKAPQAR
ncbi:MAG TPA: MucB/RseB C-terminal domain-containing protein [Burkholderiaceae bacterium]|nr:MucB/RseB C-terminal domain-containing protein [Burkholderiaceae bacterium]